MIRSFKGLGGRLGAPTSGSLLMLLLLPASSTLTGFGDVKVKLKGDVGSFAVLSAGVHRSRAAHRGYPPTPRCLTFSVFPAQFSVEVFDDPRQLLLLRLARRFVRDGDVKVVRLVFRLYRLHMVPELHNTTAAAAAVTTTSAAGSLSPEPSYEPPGEL